MTKVEIIKETAAYYNINNIAIDEEGSCVYLTSDNKMCAVGRCLESFPQQNSEYNAIDLLKDYGQSLFKEEYKGHEAEFWESLQTFHDNINNFTKEGLSKLGEKHIKNLLEAYPE